MTFMVFVVNSALVAVGGFFGAIARFGVSRWVNLRFAPVFPYGTMAVNWAGAFLLGLIISTGIASSWQSLFGVGFMGAFTTFSTFKLENVQLGIHKHWKVLASYLVASYIGGISLAFFGIIVGMGF